MMFCRHSPSQMKIWDSPECKAEAHSSAIFPRPTGLGRRPLRSRWPVKIRKPIGSGPGPLSPKTHPAGNVSAELRPRIRFQSPNQDFSKVFSNAV